MSWLYICAECLFHSCHCSMLSDAGFQELFGGKACNTQLFTAIFSCLCCTKG